MSEWLYLGSYPKDPLMKRVLERGASVMWVNKAPTPAEIQSRELVVEAFSEEELKREALEAIAHCEGWKGPVASLIGNGSATYWAAQSGLGGRFIGFRLCPSPDDIRSVELLRGEITDEAVLQKVQEAFERTGLVVVVCKDQAGGILPRVVASMINEAAYMVLYGIATVEEIDRMMRLGANFPMGPLEWADRIGLDHVLDTLEAMRQELGPHYYPCPWIRRKVEAGHLGVKAGQGFYRHEVGGES